MALQLLYRVLAFSTNNFHLLLSWARVFQFGTFIFCISFLTSSSQHIFCLPIDLLEIVFRSILPLPFSYLASFQCDRASSVFVLGWSLLCSYILLFHPTPGVLPFNRNFNQKLLILTMDPSRHNMNIITFVFWRLLTWRWLHEWPKHVGGPV